MTDFSISVASGNYMKMCVMLVLLQDKMTEGLCLHMLPIK